MKKNFLTGLILLLPFTLTLLIFLWTFNFLTDPFQGGVEAVLNYYNILNKPLLFFSAAQVLYLCSKLLVFILLVVFLLGIGFLGQQVLLATLFRFGGYAITKIPFVNHLYKMFQDVVNTIFDSSGNAFSQVVIVPFPNSKAHTIALMTQEQKSRLPCDIVSVFVPGAPNPTFGFMLTYKYADVVLVDMAVEDALKFIVSCGIMSPGFQSANSLLPARDSLKE